MEKLDNLVDTYGFKRKEDKDFPPMVFAEITNICNLNCIHCPYSYISKQKFYKPRHMEFDIYKKIVDEVSRHKEVIFRLVCDGEPMMHPRFLEMLSYAKQKEINPLCFNTNGTLLNEKASSDILRLRVDVVEISLDALTKKTYEHIRRGANFEKVISNVNRFIELRNELNAKTKIMVSIIDQPKVKYELNEFIKYWTPKVNRVITRTFTSVGGLIETDKREFSNFPNRWPCPLLWTRIFINTNGVIKFCVEDWLDETIVSHIKRTTIRDAWQSTSYNKLRRSHLAGNFSSISHCKECHDWSARRWDYDYFYALNHVLGNKSVC